MIPRQRIVKFNQALEAQGATIRQTRNGYQVRPPNGKPIFAYHLTLSDWRALANLKSQLRASGLEWPKGIFD